MTGLYNRTFFEETLQRLEKERLDPLSIMIATPERLEACQRFAGHQAGDALIRRTAECSTPSFEKDQTVRAHRRG